MLSSKRRSSSCARRAEGVMRERSDSTPEEPPATARESRWSLYVLRTADDSLYTGITTDVSRRVAEHQEGRGARSLRGRGPLQVVYQTAIGTRSLALRAEHALKHCPKGEKEDIVASSPSASTLLERLGVGPAASGGAG